ncbi:MAG TPA: hypothetical protein DEP82_06335 [Arthrobacter bacterium]|jgi:hypothetical protein|nr:hypothetical protein [Arthrobacter sp.]HCB57545.1 hypothetical protein [Arthrobacter sp.]HCC41066.1 hypothetical protein [Arthrobacter sp.]
MQDMTTSAVRQPQGISAGGQFTPTFRSEPQISLIPKATADIAARAAAETPVLARRRVFLQAQLDMVLQQQRSLACAAAAHHVLERHPDAEVLIFAVKCGQPSMLANVLDGAGRRLPARRTGEWADAVANEIRHEAAGALADLDGVESTGATLKVDIRTVVAAVEHLVNDEPLQEPQHEVLSRTVA